MTVNGSKCMAWRDFLLRNAASTQWSQCTAAFAMIRLQGGERSQAF
jgi:hypothetical protein